MILIKGRFRFWLVFIAFLIVFLSFPPERIMAESPTNCPNRYVTLINPVRGRDLWYDQTLKPLIDQYSASAKYNFPATWLLQYDALTDSELINEIKSFKIIGEKGVFLEISKNLANESKVIYTQGLRWSDPSVVFLSAYSQSERRHLIDTLFHQFKKDFGFYPKSVGAWWIDSYSLNYIKEKYGLNAILIVADQKTTDSYGVWGQWWGYPYFPSKYNVLIPAINNSLGAVVVQWAQRDPVLAYGESYKYSNFSLQANDYIRSGKDINYFKNIVDTYLNCQNPVGQLTIGLETGSESVSFAGEYLNELNALSEYDDLKAVTMSDFAKGLKSVNKDNPPKITIGSWNLTPFQRENRVLKDYIKYHQDFSFSDYYISDRSHFLSRDLSVIGEVDTKYVFPWFMAMSVILGIFALRKHKFAIWLYSSLFAIASFGLIFRSTIERGWQVFYGPNVENIVFIQCLLVLIVFILSYLIFVKAKIKIINKYLLMYLLPLSFGLDRVVSAFRYSVINGSHVVGFLIDRARIVGLTFDKNGFGLFNKNFSITESLAFLKFPIDKIWQNPLVYLIAYPLAHIFIAIILYVVLVRVPNNIRNIFLAFLILTFAMQIIWIFNIDPMMVLPVIK